MPPGRVLAADSIHVRPKVRWRRTRPEYGVRFRPLRRSEDMAALRSLHLLEKRNPMISRTIPGVVLALATILYAHGTVLAADAPPSGNLTIEHAWSRPTDSLAKTGA